MKFCFSLREVLLIEDIEFGESLEVINKNEEVVEK